MLHFRSKKLMTSLTFVTFAVIERRRRSGSRSGQALTPAFEALPSEKVVVSHFLAKEHFFFARDLSRHFSCQFKEQVVFKRGERAQSSPTMAYKRGEASDAGARALGKAPSPSSRGGRNLHQRKVPLPSHSSFSRPVARQRREDAREPPSERGP